MYLTHIQNLRALAIFLIVAGHAIGFFSWKESPFLRNALEDLVANGTVLFVFISGYLFQHLSGKFRYGDYLGKKTRYVLIPYLIVSVPAIIYSVFLRDPALQYSELAGKPVLYQVLWFYLQGGAHLNYPLWFIPMILIYFAAAPVFMLFVRYPVFYSLLLVLLPVSLLAHRPDSPNPELLHSSVYFLSAYVLGMFASQYRERVEAVLDRYLGLIVVLFIGYYAAHLFLSEYHGNYHVPHLFSLEKGYVDWIYLQKILLAFLLVGLLKRHDSRTPAGLRTVGDASFSIYFLHAYVIYGLHVLVRWRSIPGSALKWLVLSILVFGVCFAITRGVQWVFGKNSRILIGS